MIARILHRYNEANYWAELNPVLGEGELGIESDTGLSKLGDGSTHWNQLKYCGARDEDQKYFFQSLAHVPRESIESNLRGKIAYVYTGAAGKQTDRAFMYLNKTKPGEKTVCELIPISYFAYVRDQAEIKQNEGTQSQITTQV